jgi:hypothetical protein
MNVVLTSIETDNAVLRADDVELAGDLRATGISQAQKKLSDATRPRGR